MLMFLTWNGAGKINLILNLWTLWKYPGTESWGRMITQSRGSSPGLLQRFRGTMLQTWHSAWSFK